MRYRAGSAFAIAVLLGLASLAHGAQRAAEGSQRFSVHVEGRGHDVLLIPGLASSAEVWQGTAARLRDHYRVHTIQVNGFAGAPAGQNAQGPVVAPLVEDLAAYIDASHLVAPYVVGHSLGGEAALMLAARHPASVARIVVIDALPFYSLTLNPDATVESARPQADLMRATLLGMPKEQFDAAQAAGAARLVKNVEARKKLAGATAASDQGVIVRSMHELMTTDLRSELGAITVPTAVIYAYDASYGVPESTIDALFRSAYTNLKAAKFVRVNDTYHFIMYDQPERLAEALTAFIAGQ